MIAVKKAILEQAKEKFVQFGSKHITMDELATLLGMSKKTIYKYYGSKEELVTASVDLLIEEFKKDVKPIIGSVEAPLKKIVAIYDVVFDYLLRFKPSFVFGLQKYYAEAYATYKNFTGRFVDETVVEFLKEAQKNSEIRSDVNIELFAQLYFKDLGKRLYSTENLFEKYSKETLLQYTVTNNLRGIKEQ